MIVIEKKEIYLLLSFVFYSIFVFFPVTRILPVFIKSLFIAVALLMLLLYDFNNRKRLIQDLFFIICIVMIDLIIYYGVWYYTGIDILSKNLMLFVFWMPLLYVDNLNGVSDRTKKGISNFIELLIIIECVTTLLGNIRYPYASRQLASIIDINLNRGYQGMNIGGYGFVYALVAVLPFFFYKYKTYKNKKYLVILIISESTIISTAYMTAILLSIIALIICVMITSAFRKQLGIVIAFIIIAVVLFHRPIADFFYSLYLYCSVRGQHIMAERFNNIYYLFLSGELVGDMGYRNQLTADSWRAFLSSPLTGNLFGSSNELGHHSEFIDILGGDGILGLGVIAVLLFPRIKNYYMNLKADAVYRYGIVSLLAFAAIGFLNNITTAPELSAVIFLLYHVR